MLNEVPPMVTVVAPVRVNDVEVTHFTVTPHESQMSALAGGYSYCPAGDYAVLRIGKATVMSDTRVERLTNSAVVREARGRVLIAGFGLGMILTAILKKANVSAVTVVEVHPDVLTAVRPQIERYVGPRAAAKLTVHVSNIHDWRPATRGRQFDTMYFDIWTDVSEDDLAEMSRLRRTFAPYLRVGGWAGCWKQDHLRDLRRSGRWR